MFKVGYKDEVSGKHVKILIGTKEEKALGALVQVQPVGLEEVKINLDFINVLEKYFETVVR